MWDWGHFKNEGGIAHTKRSAGFAALLLASGVAMILHMLLPFWQQPKMLQRESVSDALCPDKKVEVESPEEHAGLERAAAAANTPDGSWVDAKGRIRPGRLKPGSQKKE